MLAFTDSHAEAVKQFKTLARHDPFDRMLLAQAKAENLRLITADRMLLDLELPFVVDAPVVC